MFPIRDANNVRVPLTWDTDYVINSGSDARDIIEIDGFSVRDVTTGEIEPYRDRNGFEAYRQHHVSKIIRVQGVIRKATAPAALAAFQEMAYRFNPNLLYEEDRTSAGFRDLTYVYNGESNLYEARPVTIPDLIHNIYQGSNVPFTLDLLAKPWRKVNPLSNIIFSGNTIVNAGDTLGWPLIEFTLTSAGSASWTLSNSRHPVFGGLQVDLSAYSTGTIRIDMENRTITHNNASISNKLKAYEWWPLYPGNNVITISGGPTSATFHYYEEYRGK